MRSITRTVRMLPCIAMLALPGCTLFAGGRPIVQATPSACSELLPEEWLKGVPSADLPNGGAQVGDWIKFGDAQTGQLDKANERYAAGVGVVRRCEERDRQAVKRARPKVLGLF